MSHPRSIGRVIMRSHKPWTREPLLVFAVYLFLFVGILFAARLVFAPTEAAGGTQSELDSFLNEWETQLRTTAPGFFQGQQRGFVTGGAADLRFPARHITPLTLSLPSIKSGCGGISFFGGAFSFINSEQFTQFLQNIAQNAVGVAFDMALRTLCPQCATVLANMEAIVRNMTGNLAGSCRAAKALLHTLAPDNLNTIQQEQCATIHSALGTFSDVFEAKDQCKNVAKVVDADRQQAILDALNPSAVPQRISQNVFWAAYDKLEGLNPFWDRDHGEQLMSLLGTFIIRVVDSDETNPGKQEPKEPTIDVEHLLAGWAEGGVQLLRCEDAASCLNVNQQPGPTFEGFEAIIDARLTDYANRAQQRFRSTPNALLKVNVAGVPIIRLLSMVSGMPGGPEQVISVSKRIVAINLLESLMHSSIRLIRQEVSRQKDNGLMKPYLDALNRRSTEIDRQFRKLRAEIADANTNIQTIVHLAREAQGQGSPALMGNLGFAIRSSSSLTAR